MAYAAGLEFVNLPGDHLASKSARSSPWFEKLEQGRPGLPEQANY
jgi:hypothetical protein